MDELTTKYNELEEIFKKSTIKYLKSNNYEFGDDLHKFTLQTLIDKKFDIFEDLILNGEYDDNYDIIISSPYTKRGQTWNIKHNLLDTMGEKKYITSEYYLGIISSNKKNCNVINANGTTWLYNAVQMYNMDETLIIDIIGDTQIKQIHNSHKKINKFFKKLFQKEYDKLLFHILTNIEITNKLKNTFIELINNTEININNFKKSSHKIYELVNPILSKIKINSSNCFFYLEATKNHFPSDYSNIICSDFIYDRIVSILGYEAINYYMENNTMLAKEIFEYIDLDLDLNFFKNYTLDAIEFNLVKLYSNVCEGLFKYDYIPHINNAIIYKYDLDIGYKDVEDYKQKIKPIIPKLAQISNIQKNLLSIFAKSVKDSNSEFCELILTKKVIQTNTKCKLDTIPRLYQYVEKTDYNDVLDELLKYSNSIDEAITKREIITDCLDNNMDDLIIMLIELEKITLYNYKRDYNNSMLVDTSSLYGTFLELIFKKRKISLIKKIIDSEKLYRTNSIYSHMYICSKKYTINYCLFLGLYYNLNEIVYDLIENYSQYIDVSIFVFDQHILTSTNVYSHSLNKYVSTINYKINSPYIKTSCLDLIVKNISKYTYVMDLVFDKYINKLPYYLVDSERNSLFTILIKYDLEQYLVKLINAVGKNIFQHIPMTTLNIYNIRYIQNFSNGMEFYWACKKNLPVIADFLIDNKLGKFNFIDAEGNTSLIFACKYKINIVAEKIIKVIEPLHINHTNNENKCAYEYAKSNNMEKICALIEDINKKFAPVPKSTTNINTNHDNNENKTIKVKIISNPLNTNPFENLTDLKNSELIKVTEWIKKQSMENK